LTVANRIDLRLVLHLVVSNHAWIHKYSTWIPVCAPQQSMAWERTTTQNLVRVDEQLVNLTDDPSR
jgi:hypothetical protein